MMKDEHNTATCFGGTVHDLETLLHPQVPERMRSTLKAVATQHGPIVGCWQSKRWREAYCASTFATLAGADTVRLYRQDPSNFEIVTDGETKPFELVEVFDRDRPKELSKELDRQRRHGLQPEWQAVDGEGVSGWFAGKVGHAVAKKAAKGYDKGINLAVYVHAWAFWDDILERCRHEAATICEKHAAAFAAIWIVIGGRLMRFPDANHQ